MTHLFGINIPDGKPVAVALTAIHGMGRSKASQLCDELGIGVQCRARELTKVEWVRISKWIEAHGPIEGYLRREVRQNVQRFMEIGCYRGLRHSAGLPCRGQRTHSNGAKRLRRRR